MKLQIPARLPVSVRPMTPATYDGLVRLLKILEETGAPQEEILRVREALERLAASEVLES